MGGSRDHRVPSEGFFLSLERLKAHQEVWKRKPVLAQVYGVWFDVLLGTLKPRSDVLEVGAGPGFLSRYARLRCPGMRWVATDIVETPWNDVVADGACLPLRPGSIDAVIAFDLIHHLARPAEFFSEASRILRSDGHVAVIEPWITPASYPVYRFFHEEGCRMDLDPWNPFGVAQDGRKDAFQGDAAVVFRLLRESSPSTWRRFGLKPPRFTVLNGFAYLLSLGFQTLSLLPRSLAPLVLAIDRRASALAPYLGMRVLVVWERDPGALRNTPAASAPFAPPASGTSQ